MTMQTWWVSFVTVTGAAHEFAVVARSDDNAAARIFDQWQGEPIARWTRIRVAEGIEM